MEILKIKWCYPEAEGSMEIILDKFFPCTVENANKVFNLASQWCSEETISELKEYFRKKISHFESIKTDVGIKKEYSRIRQLVSDDTNTLHTGKHPNGVPVSMGERKELQKNIIENQKLLKSTEDLVKNAKSMVVKYDRMLKLLNSKPAGRK